MYKIQFDAMDASRVYIYEEKEFSKRLKLIVHQDIDLAYKIVDILNQEEEKNSV